MPKTSETMEVFAPGTAVSMNGGDVSGVVNQVCLGHNGVQYQVAWWDKATRYQSWLDAAEVTASKGAKRVVFGFAAVCNDVSL